MAERRHCGSWAANEVWGAVREDEPRGERCCGHAQGCRREPTNTLFRARLPHSHADLWHVDTRLAKRGACNIRRAAYPGAFLKMQDRGGGEEDGDVDEEQRGEVGPAHE